MTLKNIFASWTIISVAAALAVAVILTFSPTHSRGQNAPPAGMTVAVRMIEAVDSGRASAGQPYRAAVAKAVDAGGITIPEGAAATVALAKTQTGWAVQLISLTIGGQSVAVTSSSASVTGSAQNAVANAVTSALGGLGGLGRRTRAPSAVEAVATGQRVVLPPGTSLSFVLGATPSLNAAAPTSPPTAEETTPSARSSPAPSPGTVKAFVFCFTNFTAGQQITVYISDIFERNFDCGTPKCWGIHMADNEERESFEQYLEKKYSYKPGSSQIMAARSQLASQAQEGKASLKDRNPATKFVETGWKPAAQQTAPSTGPHKDAVGFMYCKSGWGHAANTDYFAGVFPTSVQIKTGAGRGGFIEGGQAFYHYLASQGLADDMPQPSTKQADCYVSPREEDVRKEMQDAEQISTATNRKIVKIDWTYK